MHYIYKTYDPVVVVFECDAADILAADKLFLDNMGKKPESIRA